MRTLVVGRCLSACRAMLAAAALMPSGWLWVTSAVRCPKSSASSSEEAIIPAGGAAHGRAVAEAVVGVGMENTSASVL